ncbi:hypothetical protein HanPSC8_Chr16g0738091 [Helianthus annuus]|nr:hypothetical protein HanPSC8_Chr16g0738091 [Helianthus annuus]
MQVGVGIGVGLLVRTYQSTTRNFRRRLLCGVEIGEKLLIHSDTWLKTGLMKFKELFGSFTSHRVGNWSIGTRYRSTGSARSEK